MIHLITGGERSGKSSYAERLALTLSDAPVYLATARDRKEDQEFQARISKHKDRRDEHWSTIEEPLEIAKVVPKNRVVVMDCVTLWLTNYFMAFDYDMVKSLEAAKKEFGLLLEHMGEKGTLLIVSNELGMGLHADSRMGRDFVSLQGWMNQHIAQAADKVSFMVAGLPLSVK